jgi:hypothetical protein
MAGKEAAEQRCTDEFRNGDMNINLHIERLVLEGLPVAPSQSALVQSLVERELARLLAQKGVSEQLQSGTSLQSVRAGDIQFGQGAGVQIIGRQIARAVHSHIRGSAVVGSRGTNQQHLNL